MTSPARRNTPSRANSRAAASASRLSTASLKRHRMALASDSSRSDDGEPDGKNWRPTFWLSIMSSPSSEADADSRRVVASDQVVSADGGHRGSGNGRAIGGRRDARLSIEQIPDIHERLQLDGGRQREVV